MSIQNVDAWILVTIYSKLVGSLFHFSNTGVWKDCIVCFYDCAMHFWFCRPLQMRFLEDLLRCLCIVIKS